MEVFQRSAICALRNASQIQPGRHRMAILVAVSLLGYTVPASAQRPPASESKPETATVPVTPQTISPKQKVTDEAAMKLFLDRLMMAELGGRDDARNPRSTAVGPFQFIEATFLEVARRHFPNETSHLTPAKVLQLRTDRQFARRAADAFTRDNAAHLAVAGLDPTFANLRLAFLVGPGGAVRVLKADPRTSLRETLGAQVVQANPFMIGMTTADLSHWAHRNLSAAALGTARLAADPNRVAGARGGATRPAIPVRCDRGLASCRRWIALAIKRASRLAGRTGGRRSAR